MALSRLVRKQKKTSSAKELIESAMRQAIGEYPPMRPDDWVRISSLGALCPREQVLRARFNVPKKVGISPDLGFTFEFGHDVHYMMQNKVMPATGKIVGSWRCVWCGEIYGSIRGEGLVPRPDRCIRCGGIAGEQTRINNRPVEHERSESFLFVEEWVGNYEHMIGGSPDGYYVDGDVKSFTPDDVVILEFKGAADGTYVKFEKAPDFMHVIQAQCYMWITGFKRSKIIYINKGNTDLAGIAEHDIVYDPETITMVTNAVKQLRAGLVGGPVPAREACSNSGCPRAKACDVSKQCFSGDF